MTASSFLVPAVGILTQPILAQALAASGRGTLAAAVAPAALTLAVATLGLPEALTYYLAKHPRITRPALLWATLVTVGLGGLSLLATVVALPFLAAGEPALNDLIVLAMALTVPALVIGVLRGAACGRQMWTTIAAERLINTVLRLVVFGVLWALGELTVLSAVVVSCLSPLVAGVVYWKLLLRPPYDESEQPLEGGSFRPLVSFGSRVWLGAIASMLLARIGQILMAPLSDVEQLGIYSVASTVSDLPLIVAVAVQGALYGANSRTKDATQLTTMTRLMLLIGALGCTVLGATLPLWIVPLFGAEFAAAVVPTLMLLASALICIPGLTAAAAISAWGRPGLRSVGLIVTLVLNISLFVLLVPGLGVLGACWTSIASNVLMTGFMVIGASRVMSVPVRDFLVVRSSDVRLAWREGSRLVRWIHDYLRSAF